MLPRFGLFPVRSPLLGESRLISVPPGTEMFQFPRLAPPLARGWRTSRPVGLPHSVILGSRLVCSSPRLIAAYHDLHRLSMPRHPPCALLRLISNCSSTRCTRCSGPTRCRFPHRTPAPRGPARPHPIRPSIIKEQQSEQEMPGVRATSETLSARPARGDAPAAAYSRSPERR